MKTDRTTAASLSTTIIVLIPLWQKSIMLCRSGNGIASASADQHLLLMQQLQYNEADSTWSDDLPCIDDDEQDYA
eukprot:1119324-Ditylum_brightwellii.AAC.1